LSARACAAGLPVAQASSLPSNHPDGREICFRQLAGDEKQEDERGGDDNGKEGSDQPTLIGWQESTNETRDREREHHARRTLSRHESPRFLPDERSRDN
jgi:hypothetical protein